MTTMKRDRSTLKEYFKKGCIPTESNFADLIDSMLNQEEDKIEKLPNGPLSVTGALEVNGPLSVTGPLDVKGSLNVTDALDVKGPLCVTGKAKVDGEFAITSNLGIGTTKPIAKLDVQQDPRTDTHPTAVKGLYVTGPFGPDCDGIEFRHSNGTQGIGFGYNTIYATGSNADQNLGLKARGKGRVIVVGDQTITGTLTIGEWTIVSEGTSLFIKHGDQVVIRFSTDWDRFLVFKDLNNARPYFFYNKDDSFGNYKG